MRKGANPRANPTQMPAGWPIVDRGLLMTMIDDVCTVYFEQALTDAGWMLHMNQLAISIDARSSVRKTGVVYHCPRATTLDQRRRTELAGMLAARRAQLAQTTAAYAMATESALARVYTRTLFWLAPPPYPFELVRTPQEAFAFVARYLPTLDPVRAAARYAAILHEHGLGGA